MESYGRGRDTEVRHLNLSRILYKAPVEVCKLAMCVRRPEQKWEGANEAMKPSVRGEVSSGYIFRTFSSINMHLIPTALNIH